MKKKLFLYFFFILTIVLNATVHTTYLWHLQQPIYWPELSNWNPYQYQTVWESQWLKDNNGNWYPDSIQHPMNNLTDIFGNDDRKAVYQYRCKDAVQSLLGFSDAGAQVNYSGCLMQNVNSLAYNGQLGYSSGWQNNFITARGWSTSGGKPRMDIVGFSMHHVISPLVDENCLRKQIQAHRYIYEQNFGSIPDYSKGYWPAECSFSERIIKVLVEEGFEWSVVANSHLARTLADYPLNYGTSGCNIDPPNQADVISTFGNNWWNGQIDGRGGTFAAPFCYQAHNAKYVDPETEIEYEIVVVPMCDLLSYINGYGTMGTSEIDTSIAPFDDPNHPSIVLMAHDGDNAWGGGFSYYSESVPNFAQAASAQGYTPTTIEQFLADNPIPTEDVIHVEDGSWVNAANDWGHPQFINWLWPMYDGSNRFDPYGWTEDARNWAVLTAAENHVEMAEDLTGNLDIGEIVYPDGNSNLAEIAWHHLLPAYTSGYMYYGTSLDMEVKQTLACNYATDFANQVIEDNENIDCTPPTVFIPQRYPYNPGDKGFGPTYGYQEYQNGSDFHIWTFAYDVSGLSDVILQYRIDNDGKNPLDENDNDTYSGGSNVGSWNSINMTERQFPIENVTGNPDIDFFILPDYIANEYYAEIPGYTDVLIDYYVEAHDTFGNCKKTPIQHVYVGNSQGGANDNTVWWDPEEPEVGDEITIYYGEDALLFGAEQIIFHWGINDWNNIIDEEINLDSSENRWYISISTTTEMTNIDFVFKDSNENWDNNFGNDWHIPLNGSSSDDYQIDGELDENIALIANDDDLNLYADWNGTDLYLASTASQTIGNDVFIFISDDPTTLINAPWNKNGQVGHWSAYLANESANGWSGWFDYNGTTQNQTGSVLEGTITLNEEYAHVPDTIFISLGVYETVDNGVLLDQLPSGNTDGNLDGFEFYELDLSNEIIAPQNLLIETINEQVFLSWDEVSNADSYKVFGGTSLENYLDISSSGLFGSEGDKITWSGEILGNSFFYFVKAISVNKQIKIVSDDKK